MLAAIRTPPQSHSRDSSLEDRASTEGAVAAAVKQ